MTAVRFMKQPTIDGVSMSEGETSARSNDQVGDTDGAATVGFRVIGPVEAFCLRRTGGRPLQFRGSHFAGVTGWSTDARLWHEINLYRRDNGDIIVDVRVFKTSIDQKDSFHVSEFASLDEAAAWLESYDAKNDVDIDMDIDDAKVGLAELSVQAIELKIALIETERQFHSLVGELFYDLRLAG